MVDNEWGLVSMFTGVTLYLLIQQQIIKTSNNPVRIITYERQ